MSKSDHEISSSKAAIAAIGISASSGALTAASSSSQSDANTAASGVRAPASRLGNDRFSEPHETYDENSPPTMFDSPWPRNSRLASMCWPERAATALAIEIDWPRATIVSAKAMPTRSGSRRRSNAGKVRCGQIAGIGPTTATRWAARDAIDRERERGRGEQAEQHVRRARPPALQRQRCGDREHADGERGGRDPIDVGRQVLGKRAEAMRARRRQAEQVGQRVDRDQRRRAAHEAAQRRRRDEVGDRAEAQRADQELHDADEHGDGERERDVLGRADERERRQRREPGRASWRWSARRRRASSSRTAPRRCTE